MERPDVDPRRSRFPNCIVWCPIPCISWLIPFIGHTGVADEEGIIFDFAGAPPPYTVGKDQMAFGQPTKYLQLDPLLCTEKNWDSAVMAGNTIYSRRTHNLIFDNCHSHVAQILNLMAYNGRSNYSMFSIGIMMFFYGKHVGAKEVAKTYLPFICIVIILWLFFR